MTELKLSICQAEKKPGGSFEIDGDIACGILGVFMDTPNILVMPDLVLAME